MSIDDFRARHHHPTANWPETRRSFECRIG
jgi:hypothetical protein